MAYSYTAFTGNGSTTQYAVAFAYIRREHVAVTVAGVPATFTWVNNSLIQMDAAPAAAAAVRVYRTTPIDAPLVDFADGATLVAADLDTNSRQSIYIQQELDDAQTDNLPNVIPNGNKGDITTSVGGTVWAINTGAVAEAKIATGAVTETKIGTGAVTSAKILDGTILNADVNASAGITADKLSFTQAGTGATTRTVESKLKDTVSVKDFGAVGDGVANDTAAIQAAINQAQSAGKGLFFPAGTYMVSTTLTSSSTGQLLVVGEGLFRTAIRWAAASAGLMWDAGVWGLDLREITLNGRPTANSNFWRTGDTGIRTTGDIVALQSRFTGFDSQIEWQGGYYHQFSNCIFEKCNTSFYGGSVYNLHFSQCRWSQLVDGIRYSGGSGPITFVQCAIEQWTGTFVKPVSGAATALDFEGCYFENYPNTATTPPMAAGFYTNAFVTTDATSLKVSGCNINVKGIRRFLTASSAINNLTSIGNRINYAPGATATCEFVYYAASYGSVLLADAAQGILTETTGSYTTSYVAGTFTNAKQCVGYNAISGQIIANNIVSGTSVATTSGVSIDFTGIPTWAKRITLLLNGVSTNGTSPVQIQIGPSSGIVTTGYAGCADTQVSGGGVATAFATGLGIERTSGAATVRQGIASFCLLTSNIWIGTYNGSSATSTSWGSTSITLGAALDRIRLTTVNGTDTFDAGTINILYE